jgi:hypothetical protein
MTQASRTLVLTMDATQQGEIMKLLGGALGGGALVKLFAWAGRRWRKHQQEPVELTARILDDGDKFRELLLEEVKSLRTEKDAAVERAHRGELEAVVLKSENATLRSRLDRKDEQNKALQTQIIQLGHLPVVLTGPPGRADDSSTERKD